MPDNDRKQPSDARDERRRREEELDRFWDIDALIPSRRPDPAGRNTDAVEIEVDPPEPLKKNEATAVIHPAENRLNLPKGERFIPPHSARETVNPVPPLCEYEPSGYLLRSVKIYPWKSAYRYYEEFAQTAERWYSLPGRPAPQVPFFSYVPQYSQLRREQIAFYLWWRDRMRHGSPIPADYSYVLLYVYELINLSQTLPPEEVQAALLSVWVHYRGTYSQLASSLSEWICDHALIHRLDPPVCDERVRTDLIEHCALKEFYVPGSGEVGFVRCLLAFNSAYDYRKSKFYTEENKALFDKTLFTVLRMVTSDPATKPLLELPSPENSKLTRDAYTGALCSYRIKRKIEVSYVSFFRSHDLRLLVSDIVKYTENHLRAHLGVRSRLGIYALPTAIREKIDAYFAENLPPKKRERTESPEDRSYEKLYDLPQKPFSVRDAVEIERSSWDTTKRLVEAFEEESQGTEPPRKAEETVPPSEAPSDRTETFAPYADFLRAVAAGNGAAQRAAARDFGKLPDAVADDINRIAADLLGDVLLEDGENGYRVIEDYRTELDRLIGQ